MYVVLQGHSTRPEPVGTGCSSEMMELIGYHMHDHSTCDNRTSVERMELFSSPDICFHNDHRKK